MLTKEEAELLLEWIDEIENVYEEQPKGEIAASVRRKLEAIAKESSPHAG